MPFTHKLACRLALLRDRGLIALAALLAVAIVVGCEPAPPPPANVFQYDPTWGRHKARPRAFPGNHDYNTAEAAGYYRYFGASAGPSHYTFGTPIANTEAYNTDTCRVLELTLFADAHTREFVRVAGGTYGDLGSETCH
jgi:hypothetical protein